MSAVKCKVSLSTYSSRISRNSIQIKSNQIKSKTLFKDGDPVSLQLIFPGYIPTCEQYKQFFRQIYKTTQVHQTITGKHILQFHTKTYP